MSTFATLLLEKKEHIAVLTINRPDVLNALNAQVLDDLTEAFNNLKEDAEVKGIILTGAGPKAFVAGADIGEISRLNPEQATQFSQRGQTLFLSIEQFPKPVVAAINGFALGGGCELAMSCHMRIASEKARFGQPEVGLGLIAGYGGTQRLPRLIGPTKATELLLTGEMIKAQEAHTLGLVNAVYPPEDLMAQAEELLGKCLKNSPLALSLTLESIYAGLDAQKDGYGAEATAFARASTSADGREGTAAFLEKRTPHFTGR